MGDVEQAVPAVLGVALPDSREWQTQVGLMERLSDALYAAATQLRAADLVLVGAELENAAFGLVCSANHHRDWMHKAGGDGRG